MSRGNILITNHHICFSESTEHQITQEPENDSFREVPTTIMTAVGPRMTGGTTWERVPVRQESDFWSFANTERVYRGRKYFLIHLDDFKGFTWSEDALRFKHKGHWARKIEERGTNVDRVSFKHRRRAVPAYACNPAQE